MNSLQDNLPALLTDWRAKHFDKANWSDEQILKHLLLNLSKMYPDRLSFTLNEKKERIWRFQAPSSSRKAAAL